MYFELIKISTEDLPMHIFVNESERKRPFLFWILFKVNRNERRCLLIYFGCLLSVYFFRTVFNFTVFEVSTALDFALKNKAIDRGRFERT
jgi:hypothetical protein